MALNGNKPEGDDLRWKMEAEERIKALEKQVKELKSQVNYLRKLRG